MDNDNENKEYTFSYYSRIIMMIILSFEFIFNIIFLATILDIIKSQSIEENIFKVHKHSINIIFSFFFISYMVFFIELLAFSGCFINCNYYKIFQFILKNLNHLIMLITFFICQFLFLIQCVIIPVYSQGVKNLAFEEKNITNAKINIIKKTYRAMEAISYILLVLIIFFDFIVINLYKGICCQMEVICQHTQDCIENFVRWFIDKLAYICGRNPRIVEIDQLENAIKEKDDQIQNLSEEIKNQMAKNLDLNIKVFN